MTSSRSYRARQKHLERIMTVEIPENSKEIEVARSYGDLRENAEFKYAKERQGLHDVEGRVLPDPVDQKSCEKRDQNHLGSFHGQSS